MGDIGYEKDFMDCYHLCWLLVYVSIIVWLRLYGLANVKNIVSKGGWGSVALNDWNLLPGICGPQDRWSLMAMVSQDRFYYYYLSISQFLCADGISTSLSLVLHESEIANKTCI